MQEATRKEGLNWIHIQVYCSSLSCTRICGIQNNKIRSRHQHLGRISLLLWQLEKWFKPYDINFVWWAYLLMDWWICFWQWCCCQECSYARVYFEKEACCHVLSLCTWSLGILGMIHITKEDGATNLADWLTKSLLGPQKNESSMWTDTIHDLGPLPFMGLHKYLMQCILRAHLTRRSMEMQIFCFIYGCYSQHNRVIRDRPYFDEGPRKYHLEQ